MTSVLDTIADAIAEVIEPTPKEPAEESNASKPLPASEETEENKKFDVEPDYPFQAARTVRSGQSGYVPDRLIEKNQPIVDLTRIAGDYRYNAKLDNFAANVALGGDATHTPVMQIQNGTGRLMVITSIYCNVAFQFELTYSVFVLGGGADPITWLDTRKIGIKSLSVSSANNVESFVRMSNTVSLGLGTKISFQFTPNVELDLADTPLVILPNVNFSPTFVGTITSPIPTLTGTIFPGATTPIITFKGFFRNLVWKDLEQ